MEKLEREIYKYILQDIILIPFSNILERDFHGEIQNEDFFILQREYLECKSRYIEANKNLNNHIFEIIENEL